MPKSVQYTGWVLDAPKKKKSGDTLSHSRVDFLLSQKGVDLLVSKKYGYFWYFNIFGGYIYDIFPNINMLYLKEKESK